MADPKTHLRIRVVEDEPTHRRIEVLDASGHVLGDLSSSIAEVRYRATARDLAILSLDIAVERARVDSIEVPAYNCDARSAE